MKLSEIKQMLAAGGIQLTKSLGQNFLHDANQLRRIVAAAELNPTDKVLEIGPGLGPLTERLVERAGQVLAIEKDARLVEAIRKRFQAGQASRLSVVFEPASSEPDSGTAAEPPKAETQGAATGKRPLLQLIHADALQFLRKQERDWSDWKLVANLPYSVASPILVELAQTLRGPRRMVVTLQLEVAKRLLAGPAGADYGALTLLVQLDYLPQAWFKIPASCFFPEPDVDSACVTLARRAPPLLVPELRPVFSRVVKRSFSQRRKMMLKLLKEEWPAAALERAFADLRLPSQARAETLTLEQFVRLTQRLSAPSSQG